MSGWQGFTDADLKRISGSHAVHEGGDNRQLGNGAHHQAGVQRPSTPGTSKQAKMGPRGRQGPSRRPLVAMGSTKTSASSQLSPGERLSVQEPSSTKPVAGPTLKQEQPGSRNPVSTEPSEHRSDNGPVSEESRCAEVDEIDEQEAVSRNLTNLDAARQRQRLMEEENKRRRKLLVDAIANKKKQTQAEHARLMKIQRELEKLDEMIFNDVNILRDRIEESSRTYMDAKRRYDRAEKEFIEAKIDLFEKTRSKEELTEHLYTIIQENEIRKAKKLSELSGLLDMPAAVGGDGTEGAEAAADIASQLTLLNAMAPQAIRTPHVDPSAPRKSPRSSSSDKPEKEQPLNTADGPTPKLSSDPETDQNSKPEKDKNAPCEAPMEATVDKEVLPPEQDSVGTPKPENEAIKPPAASSEDVASAGKATDLPADQEQPRKPPDEP